MQRHIAGIAGVPLALISRKVYGAGMSDLDRIIAERQRIQQRLSELEIAERVIRSLAGDEAGPKPTRGRKRSVDGIPAQYAGVLAMLEASGGSMERAALLEAINADRPSPMAEPTYASLLSKMATAHLISRADGQVSRLQPEAAR